MYLYETYGGSKENMNSSSSYYCYTIHDIKRNKFYSGSRGVEGVSKHDLLKKYFTSSSVVDFKKRLQTDESDFVYYVEYFPTRKDAAIAEQLWHSKFNVGKNRDFYNAVKSTGSYCGAGSVLCLDDNNRVYRVSSEEYSTGKHSHVCKNRMLVREKDELISISKNDYDPKKHKTQFSGYVLCFDKLENKNRRISSEIFKSNPNRYEGITKNKVLQKNKTTGKVYVVEKATGIGKMIDIAQYDPKIFKHPNSEKCTVFCIEAGKSISIKKTDYDPSKHANMTAKYFFIFDGVLHLSMKTLRKHYKTKNRKSIPSWTRAATLNDFDKNINVVPKEMYIKE